MIQCTNQINKMTEKNNKTIYIIVGIIALLLIYGGSQGWFKSINITQNSQTPTANPEQEGNYFCCSSVNGYSCSLNSCGLGQEKVYVDSFNTLSGCNAKCATPTIIPKVDATNSTVLTCQQIAEKAGALYKNSEVNSAKECLDFGKLDCQDTGKILDGYGVQGSCCYYTCIGIVTPDPVVCSNTDSELSSPFDLQTTGACTDSNGYFEDNCDNGMLREYYCEPGMNNGPKMCGYTSYNCAGMIPGTTCQNGRCV